MAKALQIIKIAGLVLTILVLIAGSGYLLIKLGVFEETAVLQKIPLINSFQTTPPEDTLLPEPDLAIPEVELIDLQEQLVITEQDLKQSRANEMELKAEVARLNQEILDLKSGDAAKRAAYKDMVPYFANMKAKDAADIISRLKDEDIIGILSGMDKEIAAEILPLMDRDKAAAITAKMLVVGP